MTLSLILLLNLGLGDYSIWSASTSRTILEEEIRGQKHLIASMQPGKYSEDYSKRSMDSEDGQPAPEALDALVAQIMKSRSSQSTRRTSSEALDACWTRLRRARGLVRPGTAGLLTDAEYSRVGSSTWICPTSIVSTRIRVELVDVHEK